MICPHNIESTGICTRCSPAFPQPFLTDGEGHLKWPGISRRDYFAAKALEGMLSRSFQVKGEEDILADDLVIHRVKRAYQYADAMIKVSGE